MKIYIVEISAAWKIAYEQGLEPKPASKFDTDGDAHMHCVELLTDHGYQANYPYEDKVVTVKCFPSEAKALKGTKQYSKKKRYLRFLITKELPTLKANPDDTKWLFKLLNEGFSGCYSDNWEGNNYFDLKGIK
jgi:hypothetical protein